MPLLATADWAALAVFALSWSAYAWLVDLSRWRDRTLTAAMNRQRRLWMETMLARDNRIIDAQIVTGLQQGAAFFASTSLLAIGAAFALLTTSDEVLGVINDLPLTLGASQPASRLKALGLMAIYAYAFFKFGWSVRLFNYVSILIGAVPAADQRHMPDARAAITRAAEVSVIAGRHFARGQRAFFFSVPFLGWFAGPWMLMGISLLVLAALAMRQLAFPALPLLRTG